MKKEDGDDLSRNSVKLRIEKIIRENTTGKKLSDQKIADALAKEGIMIARRTVSKYRQEMALDSSRDR